MATIKVKPAPEVGNEFVPYRNVPNVRFPNALAPVGRALQEIGAAFAKAQAAGLASQEAQLDVEYYKLKQEAEHMLREMARQAPADGRAFSETYGKQWLEKTQAFLEGITDPALKQKYAKLLARDQLSLEQRAYNFEAKLHDEALKRSVEELVKTGENTVISDPSKTKEALKDVLARIDQMALPAPEKEVLKQRARERVETAALRSSVSGVYQDAFLDRLHKLEGTGKNRRSSAVGHFQFIESTWMAMVRKYAPKVAETYTRAQILNLRKNYAFARQMARAYINEIILHYKRTGTPVTPGTVRLGWFLGPGGAVDLLRTPADTPVERALPPEVLRANPFLRKYKTAGGVVQWAERQMAGIKSVDLYPNVPAATKVALLSKQAQEWQNLAVADLNFVQSQFDAAYSALAEQALSMPADQAIDFIKQQVSSGNLDKVSAAKLEELAEKIDKKRWEGEKRKYVLLAYDGKLTEDDFRKLIDRGAPLDVLNAVRSAMEKRRAKDKTINPKVARWEALIAAEAATQKDVEEAVAAASGLKSGIEPKVARMYAEKLRSIVKRRARSEQEEFYKQSLKLARAGALSDDELIDLQDKLTPEQFKSVRSEVERFKRLQVKRSEEEASRLQEQLLRDLEEGRITVDEARQIGVAFGIRDTVAFRKSLRSAWKVYEEKLKAQRTIDLLNRVIESGMPLDPDAHRAELDAWYAAQEGPKHILASDDLTWVYRNLVPLAERGAIPPAAVKNISGLVLSNDEKGFWRGVTIMTAIAERNPQLLNRQFSEEAVKDWQVAGTLMRYGMDRATIFERIKTVREAKATGNTKPMELQADELTKGVTAEDVIDLLDIDGEFDPNVAAGHNGPLLLSDYKRMFKLFYPYFGNEDQTNEAVKEIMSRVWGTWESEHNKPGSLWGTQTRFMLLPPNKVYPPGPDGKWTWVDKWLDKVLDEHKEFNGERVVLLADAKSLYEWRNRKPVTYRGFIVSKNGNVFPIEGRLRPPAKPITESARGALKAASEKEAMIKELEDRITNPVKLFDLIIGD